MRDRTKSLLTLMAFGDEQNEKIAFPLGQPFSIAPSGLGPVLAKAYSCYAESAAGVAVMFECLIRVGQRCCWLTFFRRALVIYFNPGKERHG